MQLSAMCVATDFGKVLVTYGDRAELLKEIVRQQGGNERVIEGVFTDTLSLGLDTGVFTMGELWEMVQVQAAFGALGLDDFFAFWRQQYQPIVPVVEYYLELQKKKILLIAVSDADEFGFEHQRRILRQSGLDFGAVFVSYQRRKKKPKLFADLVVFLKEKGIEPSQCVVVDDLHAQAAQREYGFIPVTFDGTTQDVSVLRESLSAIFCGP